jgi:hypothetical protein
MTLYSLNPDTFHAADEQLARDERQQEWSKLHGDGDKQEKEFQMKTFNGLALKMPE